MRANAAKIRQALALAHELQLLRPSFTVTVANDYDDAYAMLPALKKFDIVVVATDLNNLLVKV